MTTIKTRVTLAMANIYFPLRDPQVTEEKPIIAELRDDGIGIDETLALSQQTLPQLVAIMRDAGLSDEWRLTFEGVCEAGLLAFIAQRTFGKYPLIMLSIDKDGLTELKVWHKPGDAIVHTMPYQQAGECLKRIAGGE